MAEDRIDENGLPVYAPGDYDFVRVVDRSTGASRNALAPEVTAAARVLAQELGGLVQDARDDIEQIIRGLGYLPPVAYAPGLTIDDIKFTVSYEGDVYAPKPELVPFTTSAWDPAQWNVVQGDVNLRSDLANPDMGALMVRGAVIYVDTIADLQALPTSELEDGQQMQVKEYATGTGLGGGIFRWDRTSESAEDGISIFKDGSDTGRFIRVNEYPLTPEMAGAWGDGERDDTAAFNRLGARISALKGGKISFRPGAVYRVGQQDFNGTMDGNAYSSKDMLKVEGVDGLIIEGNGAVLKLNDGLRYGSFDPITGETYIPPEGGFTDLRYAAIVGWIVDIIDSKNLKLSNFSVDGNQDNLIIGGMWGDVGIQLRAVGVQLRGVRDVELNYVTSNNNGLDGLYLLGASTGLEPERSDNITVTGLTVSYNGRQGCSVVGGSGIDFVQCNFLNTSRGRIITAPQAGVDIEPNGSNWASKVHFEQCLFQNNGSNGVVADGSNARDVTFNDCTFWGGFSSGDAFWLNIPGVSFTNCAIHGCITNIHSTAQFDNCSVDNAIHPIYGRSADNRTRLFQNGGGTWRDCKFSYESIREGARFLDISTGYFKACEFKMSGGAELVNQAWVGIFGSGVTLDDCTLSDDMALKDNYYYWGAHSNTKLKNVVVNGPNVRWSSWSTAGGDTRIGRVADNIIPNQRHLSLWAGREMLSRELYYRDDVPTTGEFKRGDFIFNILGADSGLLGWSCTASGTAGSTAVFKPINTEIP